MAAHVAPDGAVPPQEGTDLIIHYILFMFSHMTVKQLEIMHIYISCKHKCAYCIRSLDAHTHRKTCELKTRAQVCADAMRFSYK